MHQAHLSAANGIGLELFQFVKPPEGKPDRRFEHWRPGLFHIAVTCPDAAGLAERIALSGGRRRTRIYQSQPRFTMCYCEDPWGNALEINSRSYEPAHPVRAAGPGKSAVTASHGGQVPSRKALALALAVEQNIRRQERSLQLPVLAIGGADELGEAAAATMRLVADDVTPVVLEHCGH
jgi:hypothetical protein